ncbi:hypothetical protein D9757_008206 [Collybiopsis confluens]|uniref:J domain-containing protein n=1 Tax=Collybiopsis confluens TaxID=2823264 RepID=A0A8H5M467_9AGAR|nr:hypothetical protein D9757_008206 [Collybiopsis confluens]
MSATPGASASSSSSNITSSPSSSNPNTTAKTTPNPTTTPATATINDADLEKLLSREASAFQREVEVERILKAFKLNPYDMLDIDVGATEEVVKKRYKKLSLFIHPDKTSHPRAPEAFDLLKKAESELNDKAKRDELDAVIGQATLLVAKELFGPSASLSSKQDWEDSEEVKAIGGPKAWKEKVRIKTKEFLIDEELRRRKALQLALANEGLEARKKDEEVATRKRKVEEDKAWEGRDSGPASRFMAVIQQYVKEEEKDQGGGAVGVESRYFILFSNECTIPRSRAKKKSAFWLLLRALQSGPVRHSTKTTTATLPFCKTEHAPLSSSSSSSSESAMHPPLQTQLRFLNQAISFLTLQVSESKQRSEALRISISKIDRKNTPEEYCEALIQIAREERRLERVECELERVTAVVELFQNGQQQATPGGGGEEGGWRTSCFQKILRNWS